MNLIKRFFSFLAIGESRESKEFEGFKKYIGLGSSYILAVNPTKAEQDEIMGFESQNEPVYYGEEDGVKFANITFIVRTDPETNNGIETTNFLTFTVRNAPKKTNEGDKIRVMDDYANAVWAPEGDAKEGKALPLNYKIDQNHYQIVPDGLDDLSAFLKTFLNLPDALDYKDGVWSLRKDATKGKFKLEHVGDYFKGDISEIKEALAYQPKNKVKLLYGVKTDEEGKTKQRICTKGDFILRNSAGGKAITKLEKDLASAKAAGSFQTVDYKVCELTEWNVEPTNLEAGPANTSEPAPAAAPVGSKMPWEA